MQFSNILVPLDFSSPSRSALRLACAVAGESGSLTILCVHELLAAERWASMGEGDPGGRDVEQMLAESLRELRYRLNWVIDNELEGRAVKGLVVVGHAAEEILKQVDEGKHDLVVMGTHGRERGARVLVGSVTEQVLSRCPVPMLVTH